MFDELLKRIRLEVELLAMVAVLSIGMSSLLIADAAVAFGAEKYFLSLAVRVFELAFAAVWVSFSVKFVKEVNKLRRKHHYFYFMHIRKLKKIKDEQKRAETAELVRDLVAFYRSYYLKVKAIMALAIAVSFSIILVVAYLWLYGYMSFWDAFFRWLLNSSILLIASIIYVYVHRSWGRKLLKLTDAEKKLSQMLGEPFEP
ncbi:MAG: hypothetical protein ACK4TI_03610 [Nitrososphaerales archaeon]